MFSIAPSQRKAIKWIKALRSGKYKQGTGCLEKDGRYCCLGVAVAEGLASPKPYSSAYLTSHDEEKLGISGVQGTLSWMNDHDGFDFPAIADFLEKRIIEPNPIKRFLKAAFLP